jgi:hypothetical protein
VDVEIKEQSKQWMHTHSPNKPKKFEQIYNAHLHIASRTGALLEHFNCELFDHPPYSPDLTLNDYHLFTYLKDWLGSQHFNNNSHTEIYFLI